MKNKGLIIFLIVLCSIVVVSLVGVLVLGLKSNFKFNFSIGSGVSTNEIFNKEYDDIFDSLKINTEAADIYINESINDKIKVVVYSDYEDRFNVEESNKLWLDVKSKKCNFFCFNQKKAKVIVYLPSNYSKKIEIDTKYGDIEMDKFDYAIVDFGLNYGDVKIDSCLNAIINNNYGDIKIGSIYEYFEIVDNYGDIKIDKINIIKNSNIEDDFGDVKIGYTNEIYIDAKTSLGDVDINNNYNKSDITLKIRNSFGDIKIDN